MSSKVKQSGTIPRALLAAMPGLSHMAPPAEVAKRKPRGRPKKAPNERKQGENQLKPVEATQTAPETLGSIGGPLPALKRSPYTGLNTSQILAATGYTRMKLQRYIDAGLPVQPDGYSLPQVLDWIIDREATERAKSGSVPINAIGITGQKAIEELDILKLKREKLALEVVDKKGETVPTEQYERDKTAIINAFTSYLRNSIQRNMATLRSVHEADADVILEKFIQELTSHMVMAGGGNARIV